MTVSGNLGRDAELKHTPSGDAVLEFSVASNGRKKGDTTWVRCSVWGKRGEALAPHLAKGTRVCVVGEGAVRMYQSQGETKCSVECRVDQLDMLGGGAREDGAVTSQPPPRAAPPAVKQQEFGQQDHDDEIPF